MTSMAVGDFNGDGKPDLATANAGSDVRVLLNTTAPGTLQLSAAAYNVAENAGSATITVTRTGGSDGTSPFAWRPPAAAPPPGPTLPTPRRR